MLCPKCQHPNQDQAKFCLSCGQALPVAVSTRSDGNEQHCVQCGKVLRPGARFCGVCGTHQPAHTPVAPSVTPPPRPVVPPPLAATDPAVSNLSRAYVLRHTLVSGGLAAGLLLALMVAFFYALGAPAQVVAEAPPLIPTPVLPTPLPTPTADVQQAVVTLMTSADGRFGLSTVQGDPANATDDNKLLTFDAAGGTNDTRLWIDGATPTYGEGGFQQAPQTTNAGQTTAVWLRDDVAVTQTLDYVYGSNTGRVDTIQIKYTLANQGHMTKTVGLRLMLDTLIGGNDGVPFVVPGRAGITDRAIDLRDAAVPDFVQALESPNLTEPGVIVHVTLQGADATPPDRLVISAWCEANGAWDYYGLLGGDNHPLRRCGQFGGTPDSAIGLYFEPQALGPGANRTLVTYYGLGGISSTTSRNATLSLSFNRQVNQGDEFWITALIGTPKAGQRVRLELPVGLVFSSGMTAEQEVTAGGDFTQLSWRVQAENVMNDAPVTAVLAPDNIVEAQSITVQSRGLTR